MRRLALLVGGLALGTWGGVVAALWGPTLPWMPEALWQLMWLAVFVPFGAVAIAVADLWPEPRYWVRLLVASIVFAALLLGLAPSSRLGRWLRMRSFERLAVRSVSLVAAIRLYEKHHGHPPARLENLVPDLLPRVPSTGMRVYSSYAYLVGGEAALLYDGNPWLLLVRCGGPGINFDQFMYFPRQNYPAVGYGGRIERVHDWAYVHE